MNPKELDLTLKEILTYINLQCNINMVNLDRTYFAKTENWKHCSKIIFKYVNSTVGPIVNEKVTEKWNLWVREQYTDAQFLECLVKSCGYSA